MSEETAKQEHYDILIATPGRAMEANYVTSLVSTLSECHKRGLSYRYLNGQGSLVHNARESTLTGNGLSLNPDDKGPLGDKVTYNKVIWIDSDIDWTVKDFFKLYDSDKPVITGVYLLADGRRSSVSPLSTEGREIPEYLKNEILSLARQGEVVKCGGAGFGFIAMERGVFERTSRPWFQLLNSPMRNSRGETIYTSVGEDLSWCHKAKEAGFDIWLDPSILVGHMKTNRVGWK